MNVTVPLICVIAGLLAVIEIFRIHRRLDRIEEMLVKVLRPNVDSGVSMEPSETVRRLAMDPKSYVAAIKAYREQTGLGLKPAKDVVDRIASGIVPTPDPR